VNSPQYPENLYFLQYPPFWRIIPHDPPTRHIAREGEGSGIAQLGKSVISVLGELPKQKRNPNFHSVCIHYLRILPCLRVCFTASRRIVTSLLADGTSRLCTARNISQYRHCVWGTHYGNFDVSKLHLAYRSYPENTFRYPTDDRVDCTVGLLLPNVEIIPCRPLGYGSFEFGECCKLLTQDYGPCGGWLGGWCQNKVASGDEEASGHERPEVASGDEEASGHD